MGGGCYPSMLCRWYPSMPCSRSPGGCLLLGGACSRGVCSGGVPALGRCGLLLWPSGMAFWFGGLLIEGGLLVESGHLLWPSGVIFYYGLLVWPSGTGRSPNRDPFNQKAITEGHHTRRPYQQSHQKAITEDHFQPEGHHQSAGHQTRPVRILLECILVYS